MKRLVRGVDGNTVGQRLGVIRQSKGFTQQSLADALEIPRSNIKNWENDERELKPEMIVKIANILDISTDYLLGKTLYDTPDCDLRAVCEYTGLSEETVAMMRITKMNHPRGNDRLEMLDKLVNSFGLSLVDQLLIMAPKVNEARAFLNESYPTDERDDVKYETHEDYKFIEEYVKKISRLQENIEISLFRFTKTAGKIPDDLLSAGNVINGIDERLAKINTAFFNRILENSQST